MSAAHGALEVNPGSHTTIGGGKTENEVPCSVSVIIIVVNLLNKEDDGEDWWDRACRFLSLRFKLCSCLSTAVLKGACVCVPPKGRTRWYTLPTR